MEILLGTTIVVGVLIILAFAIRITLVAIAKANGYTANSMPMHYHIVGVSTYFTVFWLALYLLHISLT